MRIRPLACTAGVAVLAVTLAACGGGSSKKSAAKPSAAATSALSGCKGPTSGGKQKAGGTLHALTGTAPDSLDPGFGYTTQQLEADNMVYTPLITYAYKEGTAGTTLIPGLATALPTVSANQLTYTMTLRKGLKYSNGTPVQAGDFAHAVQRSIKIGWGGSSFFTGYIKGAAEYGAGKAASITGIKANNATGAITISLTKPYGAFDNVLAFVAAAPIPATTPYKVESNNPPVGIGPYKFGTIVPGQSYTLVKNTAFAAAKIPGIPTGYLDQVDETVDTNTTTEAQQVLNNQADVFDPADELPSAVLPLLPKQASDRCLQESLATVYYFFFNTKVAPFNNAAVRQAVNSVIDRTAIARLSSGAVIPGCNFLPPTIPGHQDGGCASGDPNAVPSKDALAKAKAAIKSAGLAGTPVTVWSETRSPRQEFCNYLYGLLNQLGFKATLKVVADKVYFQTIGKQANNAQTGFADWSQDFPNPSDFYLLLSKAAIQPINNENFGNVDDTTIETALAKLDAVPAAKLSTVADQWSTLDKYVQTQALMAPFGYSVAPKFFSNKVDFASAVFNPVSYLEFSTMSLK